MRRVVITGMGIVSSIGTGVQEVTESLYHGRSGISFSQEQADLGFRSQIYARPQCDVASILDRRALRFMGMGTSWGYIALLEAIRQSGLEKGEVSHERTGIIMGSGGPSTRTIVESAQTAKEKSPKKISPTAVPKAMSSTSVAAPSVLLETKGVNYSISSACATSVHCIGHAAQLIQWDVQDVMLAGGSEDLDWTLSSLFDAMNAMSSSYNESPETASRPYDKNRDGFVIAGGGGAVVVEALDRAEARGAPILAEIVGFGATSDGVDMVQPAVDGMTRCMRLALKDVDEKIDYINPHATSTPIGDVREIEALHSIFGEELPAISATKALSGHSLGAAGVQEVIYSLIMMKGDFICASAHIEELDPAFADIPILRARRDAAGLNHILTNSFGFGGTNGVLALKRYDG